MKICILGNSHVGALKRAWDNLFRDEEKADVSLTFFAAKARGLEGLIHSDGSLIANNNKLEEWLRFTSNGQTVITPIEYDVILLYGLGVRAYFLLDTYYSKAASILAIKHFYQGNLALIILKQLRKATDQSIYIGHLPLRASPKQSDVLLDAKEAASYINGISYVNDRYFGSLNCELIKQPLETINSTGKHTLFKYSKGSMRLDVSKNQNKALHPEDDHNHMNDEFGKLYLDYFISKLLNK